jgi:hypothetical protein
MTKQHKALQVSATTLSRIQPLGDILADVAVGHISQRTFQVKFEKLFVETFNKAPDPEDIVNVLQSLSPYDTILANFAKNWSGMYKVFDEKSNERDEHKRFKQGIKHVFGYEPIDKVVPVLKQLLNIK